MKYDDFDLYESTDGGSFCCWFWERLFYEGKESAELFAEPEPGLASEEAAMEHALSVYRGEGEEYISEELREWREMAPWVFLAVSPEHQLKNEPHFVHQINYVVISCRYMVHPSSQARGAWARLESALEGVLSTAADATLYQGVEGSGQPEPSREWSGAKRWEKKLQAAWAKMDKAHEELLAAIILSSSLRALSWPC